MTSLVTNIQGYSIHDGPGIRTVVFLKGCGLRCQWCSNPECISPRPEVGFVKALCTGCGKWGGGVAGSGGEALLQPRFVRELLEKCRRAGIHTCIETSGQAPGSALKQV